MASLKQCPVCHQKHRDKGRAKACFNRSLGPKSWTHEEFGLKDPNAEAKGKIKIRPREEVEDDDEPTVKKKKGATGSTGSSFNMDEIKGHITNTLTELLKKEKK